VIDMALGFVAGVAVGVFAAVGWAAWKELEKLNG
jgi:hypothetical protein